MSNAIKFSVLMCHAPIVIPDVAGSRAMDCTVSTAGMEKAAKFLVERKADVMVVLSPHTPRHPNSFGIVGDHEIRGDFGDFGAPSVGFTLPVDKIAVDAVVVAAGEKGASLKRVSLSRIDHGAAVPMQFVYEAGWRGKTILIGFPYECSHDHCRLMGEALAAAARAHGGDWVILASGDMSHRLIPGAPAGFHEKARDFDQYFVDNIRSGRQKEAVEVDPELRELAAEDVVDSVEVAAAACEFDSSGSEFISYEGPFGVGYLVAVLHRS